MIKTIGEHWVCATPARYGWAPALTRDGLERTDILAVNTDLHHRPVVEIEVKAPPKEVRELIGFWAPKHSSWLNQLMTGLPACFYRRSLPSQGPLLCLAIIYRLRHGLSIMISAVDRQAAAPSWRRMLVPLALAQFICSFAART
jgi:hypothetical protein